jgi:hypothetical protein
MDQPIQPPLERLDEAQVARLFRRAAEMDAARGTRVAVDDLRQIARDLGISSESFEAALHEVRLAVPGTGSPAGVAVAGQGAKPRLHRVLDRAVRMVRSAAVATAGLVLGFVGPASNPWEFRRVRDGWALLRDPDGIVTVMAFGITALLGVAMMLVHRRDRTPLHYQLDALMLWGMFTQGVFLGHGRYLDDVFSTSLVVWLGYSLVGGYLVFRGPRASPTHPSAGSPVATTKTLPTHA